MKKIKIALVSIAAATALLLTACGESASSGSKYDFTMPDSPTEFVTTLVTDENDESKQYAAVEFDGKIYVSYGTLTEDLDQSEIGSRLGYLVQDGVKLEDIGLFPLTSDPDQNYILSMDKQGIMQNKTFFRNSETKGKEISTPSFIKSSGYDYWN